MRLQKICIQDNGIGLVNTYLNFMLLKTFSQIAKILFMCWKCGTAISEENISRTSVCGTCGKDLHSCRNCVFYAPGNHYDCKETVEELVKDKERSNLCDFFKVKRNWNGEKSSVVDKAEQAKKAFDALFG